MSEIIWDVGKVLKRPCNKLDYTRSTGIKKSTDFSGHSQEVLLGRAGLWDKNRNELKICLHHEQIFGAVFERKQDKCCGIHHK